MNRKLNNYLILLLSILLTACKEDKAPLVGTWTLISDQQIDSVGNVINYDNNVDGQLIYTDDGKMNVQLVWFTKRESLMSDSVMNLDGLSTGVGLGTNSWTEKSKQDMD